MIFFPIIISGRRNLKDFTLNLNRIIFFIFMNRRINYFPNNRFVGGGFLGPFILGGITGGLLAPSFYPRPYPIVSPYFPPTVPRPIYYPY